MSAELRMEIPYHVSEREAHHAAIGDHRRQRLSHVVRVEVALGPAVRQDAFYQNQTTDGENETSVRVHITRH